MTDWIKDLKVGDKVIISHRLGKCVATVEKITPAGNIKANGTLFLPSGMERGGNMWDRSFLSKATPEEVERIVVQNTISKAIKLMRQTSNITLEQAKSIIVLLGNPNNKRSDTE